MSDTTRIRSLIGGETESKRICLAELHVPEDGEPIIVTKVFQPVPDGFRDQFTDADEGLSAGGMWKILPAEQKDSEPVRDGVLFRTEGYSLQYALWLIAALSAGVEVAGGMDPLKGKVKIMTCDEHGEAEWTPAEEALEPNLAATLHAPDTDLLAACEMLLSRLEVTIERLNEFDPDLQHPDGVSGMVIEDARAAIARATAAAAAQP